MSARERAAQVIEDYFDGDAGRGIGVPVVQALEAQGLAVIDAGTAVYLDVALAARHELRSLLEEFHAERLAVGEGVTTGYVARLTVSDLAARLNRLAALERGETPR